MRQGYDEALYLLPFNHRHAHVLDMFNFKPPLDATQRDQVTDTKQLICGGYKQALTEGLPLEAAGIWADEQFGAAVLRDASHRGCVTALPFECRSSEPFEFEYGANFASHIEAFDARFAKVLARYNPEGDAALNQRQVARLAQLSQPYQCSQRKFMFGLLVPPTAEQLARAGGQVAAFDQHTRPLLMVQALPVLQDAGTEIFVTVATRLG